MTKQLDGVDKKKKDNKYKGHFVIDQGISKAF